MDKEQAIDALKQPVATDTNVGDTISRQAAIDVIEAGRLTKLIDAETAVNGLKELPSVQPEPCGDKSYALWKESYEELKRRMDELTSCSDTISRQAAIDIERRVTVDTNPEHFESHQKFVEFMDDAEISSFGRWQWSNGFNTALTAVGIDLKRLPPAQPELHEGHWIGSDGSYICSECNGSPLDFIDTMGASFDAYVETPMNFCPKCGAKMKGEI